MYFWCGKNETEKKLKNKKLKLKPQLKTKPETTLLEGFGS
jgi:hypothetical protein